MHSMSIWTTVNSMNSYEESLIKEGVYTPLCDSSNTFMCLGDIEFPGALAPWSAYFADLEILLTF